MTQVQLDYLKLLLKKHRKEWEANTNPKQKLARKIYLQLNVDTLKELENS